MRYPIAFAAVLLPVVFAGTFAARTSGYGEAATTGGEPTLPVVAAASPPYRLFAPSIGRDAFYPEVSVSNASAFQGGAVMVSVANARSGTVTIFGRSYPLASDGAGGLVGFVGFGTEDPVGAATLKIDLVDQIGDIRLYTRSIVMKKTNWTVDSFNVPPPPPPDPNAPPPPPPPPDDNPLLPSVYAGVTAKRWTAGWRLPLAEPSLGPCDAAHPPAVACVSGYFGEQRSINGGPIQGHHGGTDLAAAAGTPVLATNDGTVVMSGLYAVRGNLIVIDHGAGVFSLVGHMSARVSAVGDTVKKGQVIGYVGTTGFSTGPHVHWEVAVGGVVVDGLRWLDGSQGF
ncbi:MAG: M23 family metallopeptidase [Anaerolineaceae bacterium]